MMVGGDTATGPARFPAQLSSAPHHHPDELLSILSTPSPPSARLAPLPVVLITKSFYCTRYAPHRCTFLFRLINPLHSGPVCITCRRHYCRHPGCPCPRWTPMSGSTMWAASTRTSTLSRRWSSCRWFTRSYSRASACSHRGGCSFTGHQERVSERFRHVILSAALERD